MDVSTIRQQILDSEQFVIDELRKVQTLYELKRVIRYDHERIHELDTESVAEHIFGKQCLVDYFLPLEDLEVKLDPVRIRTMIQYHDIDEVETGDIVGYRKSAHDQANERLAAESVINKLPSLLQTSARDALNEYEGMRTPEAKFVKALDKVEPVFHIYSEAGKATLARLKTTKTQHDSIKFPYVRDFPIIKRFVEVMTEQFNKEGYYHSEA